MSLTRVIEGRSRAVRRHALAAAAWAAAAVVGAGSGLAADVHVSSSSGSDTSGCGSQSEPCASVQQAVREAVSGDTIRVAAGSYAYAGDVACSSVICVFGEELTILGGFSESEWVNPDPVANPTVFDGEQSRRVIDVGRGGSPGRDTSLRLEGVTVTAGLASGTGIDKQGGGLRVSNSQLTLRRVLIEANNARGTGSAGGAGTSAGGGGLHVTSCPGKLPEVPSAVLEDVTFRNNRAEGADGPERGGLALGGGLFVQRAVVTGGRLLFENNQTVAGSGAGDGVAAGERADALGGAAALMFVVTASLDEVTATGNRATGGDAAGEGGFASGGAIFMEGRDEVAVVPGCPGPASEALNSSLVIARSKLNGNTAEGGAGSAPGGGRGGALTAFRSALDLQESEVIDNRSLGGGGQGSGEGAGGGLFLRELSSPGSIRNTVVADNLCAGASGGGGGGVKIQNADAVMTHTTVVRNVSSLTVAQNGQGISVGNPDRGGSLVLDYSIVAGHSLAPDRSFPNGAALHVGIGSTVTLETGLFANNPVNTNQGAPNAGTFANLGSMADDPSLSFVAAGPPDFDYRIEPGSPAQDAAVGSAIQRDFESQVRGGARDIGADQLCSVVAGEVVLPADPGVASTVEERACDRILNEGQYVVLAGGRVALQAGVEVVLTNGFEVHAGGELTITNQLP